MLVDEKSEPALSIGHLIESVATSRCAITRLHTGVLVRAGVPSIPTLQPFDLPATSPCDGDGRALDNSNFDGTVQRFRASL